MEIIDGRKIQKEILSRVKEEVAQLSFVPIFCDVLVGDDMASVQYVEMKKKMALSVGIEFHNANFSSSINTSELIIEIEKLNNTKNMCGIIIQLPLPSHIDKRLVLDAIAPHLDVDFLGAVAGSSFYNGNTDRGLPTALACMKCLDSIGIDLKGKNIVVLGQGLLVGKPVSASLEMRGLKPVNIDRSTENKEELIKNADVIISGVGKGKYITGDMLKKGVVVIDAGTSEIESSIVGDVDFDSVKDVASYVSPVPGGVGPVTVAMLLENVLMVAKSLDKVI